MQIWTKNNRKSEPKTTANLINQKPPWRSEGSTTSRPLGSAQQGGPCFAAWWSVLHGVASVVTDLRREPRRGSLLGGGWPRWVQIWEKIRGSLLVVAGGFRRWLLRKEKKNFWSFGSLLVVASGFRRWLLRSTTTQTEAHVVSSWDQPPHRNHQAKSTTTP